MDNNMKPLKKKISITIDPDVLEQLKDLADEDARTLSSYINVILKKHVTKPDKQKE